MNQYQDFNTIYKAMRADTWDHAAFRRMQQQLRDARDAWEEGAIDAREYALKVKTARMSWEMKQRFAQSNKGLRIV